MENFVRSALILIGCAMASTVYADDLNDLPGCSNSNLDVEKQVVIGSFEPRDSAGNVSVDYAMGYSCKIATQATKNYRLKGEVKWTLVSKTEKGKIWAAEAPGWERIFVGYVESRAYTYRDAIEVCRKIEKVTVNGESREIQMTLPKIGFGKSDSEIDDPLNFEFLKYLNYRVVASGMQNWIWSSSPDIRYRAWMYPVGLGDALAYYRSSGSWVRCVGR